MGSKYLLTSTLYFAKGEKKYENIKKSGSNSFGCGNVLTDSSKDTWSHVVPRPYGISNQIYFVSASSKINGKKITDVSGGVQLVDKNGNKSMIYDIAMAGKGIYNTAAELEQAYRKAGSPSVNVFFNKKYGSGRS